MLVGAGLAGAMVSCGAPTAEPATGPVAAALQRSLSTGAAAFDHSAWEALLAGGTSGGLVDYAHMRANRAALDGYVQRLAAVDLGALERDELKALLINAYNALTVVAILDHPGVSSIRDIDGVWTELTREVGGFPLTLDNIEHNVLRAFFKDPRIHFAVNCASLSCAPLPGWAYRGPDLENQLEERSRAFLSDPDNVRLEGGRLWVSRYFEWYGEDFTKADWAPRAESIQAFIAMYATDEVRAAIAADPDMALDFLDYDWSLNEVRPAAGEAGAHPVQPVSVADGRARSGLRVSFAGVGPGSRSPAAASRPDTPSLAQDEPRGLAAGVAWLREEVGGLGMWAPVAYGLVYAASVVFLVPGSALTIGAGVTFGFGVGLVTVFLSANLGAALAFLIARYLLRARVERWLAGREKLSAVDRAVESQGWRVVALTRLSPAFPFNVQNYFYGLTGVPFWHYVGASLVAMLPGTLLYVYIGVAGAGVVEATGGAASWGRTVLLVAGLLATLLVVVLITRTAKRELDAALAGAGLVAAEMGTEGEGAPASGGT